MYRVFRAPTAILALILVTLGAGAAEFANRDAAVAMVKRVQEKLSKDGAEATFKAITSKSPEFRDHQLYAFVFDLAGIVVADAARAELVGKELIDWKDQNGKFLVRQMLDLAKGAGSGWVDYRWTNPTTNGIEDKLAYVEKAGQYFIGVGVYKPEPPLETTIAMISGHPNSNDTYLTVASDLAAVLNNADNLRVLPVVGIGGAQNIREVRAAKGIDIGLTQTNILAHFFRFNEQLGSSEDKLVYLAKLFNEEAHLLVRSETTAIEQLAGRKVNLDLKGSGTSFSMQEVFKRLGVQVDEVSLTQSEAVEQLKRGEIAGTVLIAGKPSGPMASLKAADGLHFLSIPYVPALGDDYLPATLTHEDYPEVIKAGERIDTIAVGTVLIAHKWPKNTDAYRRLDKFVQSFFSRIAKLQEASHHRKWRDVNLTAQLPGFPRFEPAQAWVDSHRPAGLPDRADFAAFLASEKQPARQSSAQNDQLFQDFTEWNRARGRATIRAHGRDK